MKIGHDQTHAFCYSKVNLEQIGTIFCEGNDCPGIKKVFKLGANFVFYLNYLLGKYPDLGDPRLTKPNHCFLALIFCDVQPFPFFVVKTAQLLLP